MNFKQFKMRSELLLESLENVYKSNPQDSGIQDDGLISYRKIDLASYSFPPHIYSDAQGRLFGLAFHKTSSLANRIYNAKGLQDRDERREYSIYACAYILNNTRPAYENNRVK